MSRFETLRQAFVSTLTDLLSANPDLLDDITDDDARALGREAADRAVAHVLKETGLPNLPRNPYDLLTADEKQRLTRDLKAIRDTQHPCWRH